MGLVRLVYASHPFGFDAATLYAILTSARRNNARDGITGALICRGDLYLQLLEGPGEAVAAAYARIERDDRHLEVTRLLDGPAATRMCPNWAMRDDPAQSWMWTQAEVAAGAVERATQAEILGVFERLLDEAPAPA